MDFVMYYSEKGRVGGGNLVCFLTISFDLQDDTQAACHSLYLNP